MKKIYYLMAMAMMAFTFTSCEDVPEPFGQPINPNQRPLTPLATARQPRHTMLPQRLLNVKKSVRQALVKNITLKVSL